MNVIKIILAYVILLGSVLGATAVMAESYNTILIAITFLFIGLSLFKFMTGKSAWRFL